jgi:hypothetical protein
MCTCQRTGLYIRALAISWAIFGSISSIASAKEPSQPPGDSLPGDSLPGDSLPGDNLKDDSLKDDSLPGDSFPGGRSSPFPVSAYIISEAATIHCAPSLDQYTCDRLTRGQRVEIHKREGDWYGIRPTSGCFSWIGAELVEVASDGKSARVRAPQARVWIGGLDAVEQHHSQLQLRAGDELSVLAQKSPAPLPTQSDANSSAETGWLKIAPPAGEFRWVHEKMVHIPRTSSSPRAGSKGPEEFWVGRGTELDRKPRSGREPSRESGASVKDAISQLQIAVARTMSRPIEKWDIESLRLDSDEIRKRSATTWQRGQLARLEQSIDEIATLFEQHRNLTAAKNQAPRVLDEQRLIRVAEPIQWTSTGRSPGSTAAADVEGARQRDRAQRDRAQRDSTTRQDRTDEQEAIDRDARAPDSDGETFQAHYDAVGRIMPIHTTKTRTPPYGLVDDDGQLQMLLTPTPGYNIRPHIGRRVGVIGTVKSIQLTGRDYRHLLAEKVIVLDRTPASFPSNLARFPWIVR